MADATLKEGHVPITTGTPATPSFTDEGFEAWEDRICRTFVPLRARCVADAKAFAGGVESTTLGAVLLAHVAASQAQVERTPRLIKADDPELYKLGLQTSGTSTIEQDGRRAHLSAGDLAVYDTSRPYRIMFGDDFRMTVAMFPRSLVRLPSRQMADLTAVRLTSEMGLGSLVAPLLRDLRTQVGDSQPVAANHLGDAVIDLATAAFAQQLDLPLDPASPADHRALVVQVRKFIDERLQDPGLTPRLVAHAHFVSVRYLQKAFEPEGTSVSGLIRERRLAQCRRDLIDPRCRHVSIAQIGRRWGFPDAAHFSRLFRRAFGQAPREFRRTNAA